MDKPKCNCRDEVNALVDKGNLRNALNRYHGITNRAEDSLVMMACDRKSLRGRFVEGGEVRDALTYGGWSQNQIDFVLHRSSHEHDEE